MMGRWPIILFTGLLLASLASIAVMGRTVMSDMRALSTAENDDVSWTMSQIEVALLRLRLAAQKPDPTDEALDDLRIRFDVFYSRVTTLSQSRNPNGMKTSAVAQNSMALAGEFLTRTTPWIDGDDAALRAALPKLRQEIAIMAPQVRALALVGIELHSADEAARRAAFSKTVLKMAALVLALIALLFFALAILFKMFRRGQRVSQENQNVRSRLEAAVTSSLDAVLVVDTAGKVVDFNGAAEAVFGYTKAEAIGGNMADLIVPEHMREMHLKGMERLLRTGEKKVIGAGRVRLEGMRKSGEIFPVEFSLSVAQSNGEQVFVGFLRDISAELKAEGDLHQALLKAQESERAKSDLLTVMSHEMRTPLNGILGSLSLIDQTDLSARQKKHMASISVSGELLLSHVNDVLDLSSLRADSRSKETSRFDLELLVQEVVDSLLASAQEREDVVTVTFLSDGLDRVLGYRTSLQQCLVNLVSNAIKFTSGGAVSVEVERLSDRNRVEIRVADSGVGIDPANLDRIFDEFVTIDTAFDRENAGTGLGLAITRRLVENMGGTIGVDSFLGEGSLFTVTLPLPEVPRNGPRVEPRGGAILAPLDRPFRALVVDDNDINRMIINDMVTDLGGDVVEAEDGFVALKRVAEQRFDIVLMDISMPGIDGIETLKRIRDLPVAWAGLPGVAVTAHAASKDHVQIMSADFADLLVKPVDPKRLREAVSAQLSPADPTQDRQLDVLNDVQADAGLSGSGGAPDGEDDDDPAAFFVARFGAARFAEVLGETCDEVAAFTHVVRDQGAVHDADRQEAHRLSGSAAILGQKRLWSLLQRVQNVDADQSGQPHIALINAVDAEMQAIRGTF